MVCTDPYHTEKAKLARERKKLFQVAHSLTYAAKFNPAVPDDLRGDMKYMAEKLFHAADATQNKGAQ